MTAHADVRALVLAIGLTVAPLLRSRRLSPRRRAEIVECLAAVRRALEAISAAELAGRESEQAMARWAIERYSSLTADRAGAELLDDALKVFDALGVQWVDVVAAVNRMAGHRLRPANAPSPLDPVALLARLEHGARAIAATLNRKVAA